YKRERGIDAQGEEIEYNAKCFLKADSNIDASQDRWQVTDQHTGRAREGVDIQPMRDPRDDTLHHYELKTNSYGTDKPQGRQTRQEDKEGSWQCNKDSR